jgi:hypothetical protein
MSKFKVGDKVKCTYSSGGANFIPGHIYKVATNTLNQPAIASEANGQLISMAVMCDSYHWYDFERVALPVTVITTDGITTTATLREGKRVIRTATAKCSPADTFDYATGAKLAFNRLFTEVTEAVPEPENPKYYTGKLVLVSKKDLGLFTRDFTIGKVYEVKNGKLIDDDGWDRITPIPADYSKWCHANAFTFIPFVEF